MIRSVFLKRASSSGAGIVLNTLIDVLVFAMNSVSVGLILLLI
ncbi:MAG: hypothetical protein ACI9HU_000671 [Colwellia sp.]|jgi:hypothetical protein